MIFNKGSSRLLNKFSLSEPKQVKREQYGEYPDPLDVTIPLERTMYH